jgi:hypothetical protein
VYQKSICAPQRGEEKGHQSEKEVPTGGYDISPCITSRGKVAEMNRKIHHTYNRAGKNSMRQTAEIVPAKCGQQPEMPIKMLIFL